MGGSKATNYITGGLQTVAGAAATYFGMPQIGVPLMAGGIGQLTGQGLGGTRGAAGGELAGLTAGGGYELAGAPGQAGLMNLLGGISPIGGFGSISNQPTAAGAGGAGTPSNWQSMLNFLGTPGGGTLGAAALGAATRQPNYPPIPQVSPKPPPPAGVPGGGGFTPATPSVAQVPRPGIAAGGGGTDLTQQLALLRLLGGAQGA
jgi:hypothetical protein